MIKVVSLSFVVACAFMTPSRAAVSDGKEFMRERAYQSYAIKSVTKRSSKKKSTRTTKRQRSAPGVAATSGNIFSQYYQSSLSKGNVSLAGVVPPLATFARTIVADCGSRVISAVRNTRVRGSGAVSLHASGRAVDIEGNPSCIAKHLANWQGGASNDYHRIRPQHFHISWGGREHGKRFAHYQGSRYKVRRTRYARAT